MLQMLAVVMPFIMSAVTLYGTYTSSPIRYLKLFSGLLSKSNTCHTVLDMSSEEHLDQPIPFLTSGDSNLPMIASLTMDWSSWRASAASPCGRLLNSSTIANTPTMQARLAAGGSTMP